MKKFTFVEWAFTAVLVAMLSLCAFPRFIEKAVATGLEIKANTTGQIGVFFMNVSNTTGPGISGLNNTTANFYYDKPGINATAFTTPVYLTETSSSLAPGYYLLNYTTNQTDTLGEIRIYGNSTGSVRCAYKYLIVQQKAEDVYTALSNNTITLAGNQTVNAVKIGGTTQTGRDLGTSVLLSNGTGTGQVLLSSGTVTAATVNNVTSIVNGVWDEPLTGATHNVANSAGRRLRQLGGATTYSVSDALSTTTAFNTTLTSSTNEFYNDQLVLFVTGTLAGQVRSIYNYTGATKTIIVDEPLTSAPGNGDTFDLIPDHEHPVSQIAGAVWNSLTSAFSTVGSIGKLIVDNLNAAITSRMATFTLPGNFSAQNISADGNVTVSKTEYYLSPTQAFSNTGTWTGNLTGSVGSVSGNVTLAPDQSALTIGTMLHNADKTNYILGSSQVYSNTGTWTGSISSVGSVTNNVTVSNCDVPTSTRMATFTLPGNFSALNITSSGLVTSTNAGSGASAADVWSYGNRTITAGNVTSVTENVTVTNCDVPTSSRGTSNLTAAQVWDHNVSGYTDVGEAGTYVKDAGAAINPWSTSLPGAYPAGTAGYIVGTNIDTSISSRSTGTVNSNVSLGNNSINASSQPDLFKTIRSSR